MPAVEFPDHGSRLHIEGGKQRWGAVALVNHGCGVRLAPDASAAAVVSGPALGFGTSRLRTTPERGPEDSSKAPQDRGLFR
jgi:hypothetical protein